MVMGDRIKPSFKKAEGTVKRAAGDASDESLGVEARADEASAKVKQAGVNAGHAAQDALES